MEIDIRTIVLILGVTHLMQVLVFFHLFKVNKTYKGIGWWLMWSAAEMVGFIFILLREIPALLDTAIVVQNVAILAGTIFIYIGVMRFFGKKENLKIIIPFFAVYVVVLLYLLFINDNIQLRSAITSIAYVLISFLTAISLYKNKTRSISATVNFNTLIFIFNGGIFLYRAIMIFNGAPVGEIFTPTIFNFLPYFDALVVSLLWTFGFVIMVNQRLSSEMTEAKTHFEQIFSTSPDAAIITRISDGMFVDCNEAYTKFSGYSKEDMSGKTSLEINIWKNPDCRNEVVNIMKENGFCENYESIFLKKDGTEITGLVSAKIIMIQGIPHTISITRDITEHKQIQDKIKNSENKFRSLFENMAEGVALHEAIYDDNENPIEYRILDVNKAYERNTGLIAKNIRGKLSREVYKTEVPPYLNEYTGVLKSGKPYFFETYFPPLERHFSISVISPAKGQFATVFLDVTQQRKAEKEKQLFSNVLEQSLNEIYIFDNQTLKFVNVNKGAIENIGYTMDELKKMTPLDLKPQFNLAMFKELILPLLNSELNILQFNTIHRRKDSSLYPVEVHLTINQKENVFVAIILDITERKQREEELRATNEYLENLIGYANAPIIVWDSNGNITQFNRAFEELSGLKAEMVLGYGLEMLFAEDERERSMGIVNRAQNGERFNLVEVPILQTNGSQRIVLWNSAPIYGHDGQTQIATIAQGQDITERKQAEEALQKSEKDFRILSESMPQIVWTTRPDGGNIYFNQKWMDYTGMTLEESYGHGWNKPFHPDDQQRAWDAWQNAIKNNGIYSIEARLRRFDGEYRWWLVRGIPQINEHGEIQKWFGTCTDIEDMKQAEEKRTKSESKYQNLIETMPEGFYRSTAEGYFIDANPALVNMLGYNSKEELMKVHIPEALYFTKDDRDDGVIYSADFKQNTDVYRLKKKDGTEIWVEDYARYIKDSSGNILFHEGILRDVTESLRVHNEILKAKEKAEEANKTKTNFLANMSHEIRTPLNGILGFTEILKNEISNPEHIRYTKIIERSGKRLLETLHMILTFAKLDAEKQDINYSNVMIEDVIYETLQSFQALAKSKSIYLKSTIRTSNLRTKSDEKFIRSILNNLINNAIKFTKTGGVEIELSKVNDSLLIKVRDTGIGIEKDKQDIIFEEFRQESEGFNRSFEGTGLGLSITKRFVELMKGKITVESEPGIGSTFIVELPIVDFSNSINIKLEKKDTGPDNYVIIEGDRSKTSILIVENDKDNRAYVENILRKFNTDSAEDGETAIRKAKEKLYDIILMDINLGKGMDGINAVKEIRKLKDYKKTPIVALTAFVLVGDKEEFLSAGCTHYLGKPFEYKQLLELVDNILKNR